MHNRTTTWRATALVALALLLAPWASAQDARTSGRQAPAPDRVQADPVEVKVENSPFDYQATRFTGPVDLLRTGGPDAGGYSFIDSSEPGGPVYGWVDISTTGTSATAALSDDTQATVTLPWPFVYYGTSYTSINISPNGYLSFGATTTSFTNPTAVPSTAVPNNYIGVMFDDYRYDPTFSVGSDIRYQDMGDGSFVISWLGGRPWCSTAPCTGPAQFFQAILYETGDMVFQYQDVSGTPLTSSTIATENATGTIGLPVNINAGSYLANNLAIRINSDPPPPPIPAFYTSSGITEAFEFENFGDNTTLWFVGRYQVVVGGNTGTITLDGATLNVIGTMDPAAIAEARLFSVGTSTAAPTISSPTVGPALTNPGATLTFTSTTAINLAPGTNYLWLVARLNSSAVPGTNYSGSFGSVTVGGTAYTPSPAHDGNFNTIAFPPDNDNLIGARPIFESPASDFMGTAGSSVEASEAEASCAFSGNDGFNSIWWSYVPSADGTATFGAEGFDTILAVYTGSAFPLTEVGCADDFATTGVEEVSIPVTTGTTYWVRVTGYAGANGTVNLTLDGPAPTLGYTVTEPTIGTITEANKKRRVRWSGAGVPNRDQFVRVYGRQGDEPLVYIGNLRNIGRGKARVPASATTGSDYTFVVVNEADRSGLGISPSSIVWQPADQYSFSEPDANESWARGFTRTVNWTTPANGPQGGTVTLQLQRDNGTVIFTASGEPDDGSFDYAIPAGLATGTGVFFTIVSESDGAFFGTSPAFDIVRIEPLTPAEGDTWAVGSSQTVTWNTGAANNAGVVRLSLRGVSNGYSRALAVGVPYPDGTRTITVPSTGSVPPPGDYFVQLLYTYTPPGGSETRFIGNSNVFTVTNAAATPPAPERHFASPLAGEDTRATVLAVRGLSEGAEVGVFAPMGDGSEMLLASGVVESGEAVLAVPSVVVDGEDEIAFGPQTALTLRAFENGVESTLEARTITMGEGVALSAVRFAEGDVVTVDVAKGATAGAADTFTLAGVVPNPTTGAASVRFTLPESQAVTVTVYDMLGRTVATLFDGTATAGANEVRVPTLTAGVYVVRVDSPTESATTRFTVVR